MASNWEARDAKLAKRKHRMPVHGKRGAQQMAQRTGKGQAEAVATEGTVTLPPRLGWLQKYV